MTDEKPPEHPAATVCCWRYWRFELVGCLSFFSSLTLCLFLTVVVADVATRHIGRAEVSDALYHTGVVAQWCCGGAVTSIAISAIVARACIRWVR